MGGIDSLMHPNNCKHQLVMSSFITKFQCYFHVVKTVPFSPGALYQSGMGLRKAGLGGAVGLALAGIFVACTSRNKSHNDYDSSRY